MRAPVALPSPTERAPQTPRYSSRTNSGWACSSRAGTNTNSRLFASHGQSFPNKASPTPCRFLLLVPARSGANSIGSCARIAAGRRAPRRTHTHVCCQSGRRCLRPSSSKGTTGPKNVSKASYTIWPSLHQLRSNVVQSYLENNIRIHIGCLGDYRIG